MRGNWYNPHINKIHTIVKVFFLIFLSLVGMVPTRLNCFLQKSLTVAIALQWF